MDEIKSSDKIEKIEKIGKYTNKTKFIITMCITIVIGIIITLSILYFNKSPLVESPPVESPPVESPPVELPPVNCVSEWKPNIDSYCSYNPLDGISYIDEVYNIITYPSNGGTSCEFDNGYIKKSTCIKQKTSYIRLVGIYFEFISCELYNNTYDIDGNVIRNLTTGNVIYNRNKLLTNFDGSIETIDGITNNLVLSDVGNLNIPIKSFSTNLKSIKINLLDVNGVPTPALISQIILYCDYRWRSWDMGNIHAGIEIYEGLEDGTEVYRGTLRNKFYEDYLTNPEHQDPVTLGPLANPEYTTTIIDPTTGVKSLVGKTKYDIISYGNFINSSINYTIYF